MMERKLFYLCEIGAGLDSGMTLQVAHDYGNLSTRGWRVSLPVTCEWPGEWELFVEFVAKKGAGVIPVPYHLKQGVWRLSPIRHLTTIFQAFRHLRANGGVVVIRERRHRIAGILLRFLTGAAIVSEFHEGAFPRPGAGSRRRFQRFLDSLDGVVFTNASQCDYLQGQGLVLPARHIVLPNGVDFAYFSDATGHRGPPPYVLTYTGQFTSWKNLPLLFASLAVLGPSFRLRIAGGKSHGDSARYVMGLASQYGVTEGVEYLGFLHPDEVRSRAIDGSSVLLVPLGENRIARHATSPMKLIEYMATGIPVVAVGHPSVVALTGHDAAYLASTDAAEFAAVIRTAVGEDAASRTRRREKAKAIASRHDHAARAAQFDSWLSRIIAG